MCFLIIKMLAELQPPASSETNLQRSHTHHCKFPHVCPHTHADAHTLAHMQHKTTADPHKGQRVAEATGAQQPVSISRDWIILCLSPCLRPFTTTLPLALLPQTIAQTGLQICLRAEVDILFARSHVALHSACSALTTTDRASRGLDHPRDLNLDKSQILTQRFLTF